MNPFFFGNSKQPLYGVYHPPRAHTSRPTAVVLCYPLWQEYMRAHRAFRQLAMLLSKAGFSVLRFDYFGTGDSAGESDAGDVSRWTHDISTAIDELKDTAAVTKVSLVGLRVGASLAAAVATERKDLDRVILWDPVVGGKSYVEKMVLTEQASGTAPHGPVGTIGIKGFPLTSRMREGLEGIDLHRLPAPASGRMIMTVSEERPEFVAFRDALAGRRIGMTYRHI
ncbi:MAG TPA: alpha/beta hydrolase, partial [Gemmatimonadaceae bacterium]